MTTHPRQTNWLIALAAALTLSAALIHAADENWFSRSALGDVLVTQADHVLVYGNDWHPEEHGRCGR